VDAKVVASDFLYPVAWWIILPVIDAWNRHRRGLTLWSWHTVAVLLPSSVLLWLFFELLNIPGPQWRYVGGLPSVPAQVALGVVSFATVLPIVVEFWWLFGGEFGFPFDLRPYRTPLLMAAVLLSLIPFFNHISFWFNQGMWLVPALVILPRLEPSRESRAQWFFALTAAGLAMGLVWESLNWFSHTHWEYLILRSAPHLFQMPVPGYGGFIPFALSGLAVFEVLRRVRPRLPVTIALYALAISGQLAITVVYLHNGLWRLLRPE